MRRRAFLALLAVGTLLLPGLAVRPAWAETMRDRQWYLSTLDIAGAHRLTTGAGVVVAVVDTGVGAHPDLKGQVLGGVAFVGTGNGQRDGTGHGTAMAGIIAANGASPDHLLGIAPQARILPVKISASDTELGFSKIGEGIRWAADHGAKVINVSVGGPHLPADTVDAVHYALDRDVVVVAASGNRIPDRPDKTDVAEPARYPGVLAVIATDRDGRIADGALQGPEVVLAAPGANLPVLAPALNGHFEGYQLSVTGTSAAAAVVSGAAALIRSRFPQLPARDVIQRLVATADDAGPAGRDPQYGFGRLNLVRALTADVPAVSANPLLAGATATTSASPATGHGLAGRLGASTALLTAAAAAGAVVLLVAIGIGGWLVLRRRRTSA